MKSLYVMLFTSIITAFSHLGIYSQTLVQDTVSGIWTYQNSPYIVKNHVVVPENSVLIIQPGVEIQFDGHYKFVINGLLQAAGISDSLIVFTRFLPMDMYKWWGLRFINADPNSILDYCIIEYARTDYSDSDGGGIYCFNSSITITNCYIQKNHAYHFGGGIYCENSSPTIQNNTISSNESGLSGSIFDALDGSGGGICCKNSSPWISNNIVIKNKSGFEGNILGGDGGGISILEGSSPLITNNIIIGNRAIDVASMGGGVCCSGNDVEIINNVIYNNSSAIGGGGIHGNASTVIKNTILWQNKMNLPNIGEVPDQLSGSAIVTYSDIQDGYEGEGNIDQDPMFLDPDGSNFRLHSLSPCIDAGDPDPTYNDPDGTRNDMGAYGGPSKAIWTGIQDERSEIRPNEYFLLNNYPNPFNGYTIIQYMVPRFSRVQIQIYNLQGRKVDTVFESYQEAGHYSFTWNATGLPSGVYFYKLSVDLQTSIRKCLLVK